MKAPVGSKDWDEYIPDQEIRYQVERRVVSGPPTHGGSPDVVEFSLSRDGKEIAVLQPTGDITESDWQAFWDLLMQMGSDAERAAQKRDLEDNG
jgi:hypothetical protein